MSRSQLVVLYLLASASTAVLIQRADASWLNCFNGLVQDNSFLNILHGLQPITLAISALPFGLFALGAVFTVNRRRLGALGIGLAATWVWHIWMLGIPDELHNCDLEGTFAGFIPIIGLILAYPILLVSLYFGGRPARA